MEARLFEMRRSKRPSLLNEVSLGGLASQRKSNYVMKNFETDTRGKVQRSKNKIEKTGRRV